MKDKDKTITKEINDAVYLTPGYRADKFPSSNRAKRGTISKFSWSSNKRFIDLLVSIDHEATMEKWGSAKWITLTFDGKETGADRAKAHLDNLLSNIMPRAGFVGPKLWKAELQERKTIHFHILAYGPEMDLDFLKIRWHEITGSEQDDHLQFGVRIDPVENVETLKAYMSKYIAKGDDDGVEWSHGRVWGVRGKVALEFFTETITVTEMCLPIVKRNLEGSNIHLPTSIYNKYEWVIYLLDQMAKKVENRVGFYRWRQRFGPKGDRTEDFEAAKRIKDFAEEKNIGFWELVSTFF